MHLNEESVQMPFEGKNLHEVNNLPNALKIYDSENNWTSGVGVPPPRGNIYVYT